MIGNLKVLDEKNRQSPNIQSIKRSKSPLSQPFNTSNLRRNNNFSNLSSRLRRYQTSPKNASQKYQSVRITSDNNKMKVLPTTQELIDKYRNKNPFKGSNGLLNKPFKSKTDTSRSSVIQSKLEKYKTGTSNRFMFGNLKSAKRSLEKKSSTNGGQIQAKSKVPKLNFKSATESKKYSLENYS